ncbi:cytochrome c3 family protein [Carboxylicivirga marina]|uniref:Cytochrome c3 family protein n=1 Tax=Carboxylicivirga marina TaxID=2800988 RepID=A0ABS1HFB4_9BACT|nr:cytochrome c3 family protein [Carboxylicivirga marina]MBK3515884.1 cytochrome c3 family protein [Carboxylicivirga marina]
MCLGVAQLSTAQIAGTGHNFSAETWNESGTGEICKPCHTPHGGDNADAPLWNHAVRANTGFTMYSSGTFQGSTSAPGGISLKCLSCHDGTSNLDAHGGSAGTTNMNTEYTGANTIVGVDLSNDHPVSFIYDVDLATADGGLKDPESEISSFGTNTIEVDFLFGANGSRTVECASCHDPHGVAGVPSLLRVSNAGSALCLECHNK